jgi:hypothetical protein
MKLPTATTPALESITSNRTFTNPKHASCPTTMLTPDFTIALLELLSSLYTDAVMALAVMALADEGDRAADEFETQIAAIAAFAKQYNIPLYDTPQRAETDDAVVAD